MTRTSSIATVVVLCGVMVAAALGGAVWQQRQSWRDEEQRRDELLAELSTQREEQAKLQEQLQAQQQSLKQLRTTLDAIRGANASCRTAIADIKFAWCKKRATQRQIARAQRMRSRHPLPPPLKWGPGRMPPPPPSPAQVRRTGGWNED